MGGIFCLAVVAGAAVCHTVRGRLAVLQRAAGAVLRRNRLKETLNIFRTRLTRGELVCETGPLAATKQVLPCEWSHCLAPVPNPSVSERGGQDEIYVADRDDLRPDVCGCEASTPA